MRVRYLIFAIVGVCACGGKDVSSGTAGQGAGAGGESVGTTTGGGATSTTGGMGGAGDGGTSSTSDSQPPENPTHPCKLDSDCAVGLGCGFGLCHVQCEGTADCPAPERCVRTSASNPVTGVVSVCQLPSEAKCQYNSDCADPLVCALDHQCRNQCMTDNDCNLKQLCVHGVCAEPSEVTASGHLVGAVDGG